MHVRKLDAVCSEVKVHKGRARYWKGVVAALDECADNMEVSVCKNILEVELDCRLKFEMLRLTEREKRCCLTLLHAVKIKGVAMKINTLEYFPPM